MPRDYELALIVDTQLSDEDVDETVKRYETLLGEQGAQVVNVDRWGSRKLAYEIRKRQQGDYTFFLFQAEPANIEAIDRACRLDEAVLRHLVLQTDIPPQAEEVTDSEEESTNEGAEEIEAEVSDAKEETE